MSDAQSMPIIPMNGSRWLVTGAASGFGRYMCEAILSRGGKVLATGRDVAQLEDIRRIAPDRVEIEKLDVTRSDDADRCAEVAIERFGGLDVLVNNAGRGFFSAVEEASDVEMRELFDVNLFGLAAVTRAVLPIMRRQKSGCIINFSSVAGIAGTPAVGYYCASKWAVEGLSESLALEVAPFGIRVLIVEPGPFRTDFYGRSMLRPAETIADYELATRMRAMADSQDGLQSGDPAKAASMIVDTATAAQPPLRLLLGKGMWQRANTALRARLDDMAYSRERSEACEFEVEAHA